MFSTLNQPIISVICVSIGVLFGFIYDIFFLCFNISKNKTITTISNIIYFILMAILFTITSNYLKFTNFRIYMAISVIVGLILYNKSFHKIIAKLYIKVYNIVKNKFLKIKNYLKVKNERRKKAKNNVSGNIGDSYAVVYSDSNNGVSTRWHYSKKKQNRKTQSRNSLFRKST